MKIATFPLIGAALLPAVFEPVQEPEPMLRERSLGLMGTSLQIKVIGAEERLLEEALDEAIAELRRIEDLMTDWRESPLSRINARAGEGPQTVAKELSEILHRGKTMGEMTNGAFDISYAGAGQLWDFKSPEHLVPSKQTIEAALQYVDFRRITVDLGNSTVDLPKGMKIGLGGIAKGYSVDRAMSVLVKKGIQHGLVNFGGDMKVLGSKFGEPWEIAIKNPRNKDKAIAVLRLSNTALSTSGDYERFFEKDGKRYHHIIDPRTGFPSQGCMSASVLASRSEVADVLATSLCVLGPEEGMKVIEKLPGVQAILVGMDGKIHATAKLKEFLQ